MPSCPSCGRPVAMTGKRCLYCGGALAEPAEVPPEPPQPAAEARGLVLVLDLTGSTPESLTRNLGLTRFEAEQRSRRGGFHLLARLSDEAASREAERLRGEGLGVFLIPEKEAREGARPLKVVRGSAPGDFLELRGPEGSTEVRKGDLALIVRGDIARARQASQKVGQGGPLQPGLRIHLHARSGTRPVELDPLDFECGEALMGSTHLEINRWLRELFPGVAEDGAFRHEPPALAPAGDSEFGVSEMARSLERARKKDEPLLLDNLTQFRFYSAWRGAVEKRREGG
jgi:hypothetical protein